MKTMKKNWLMFFLISMIPLMASTCDEEHERHNCITFINQSNSEIYVSRSTVPINTPSDTLLHCGSIKTILTPNSKFCFEYGTIDTWDGYFSARPYVQFMVFSELFMIDGCTEEYLKDFTEKHQLKRYQLTKEDLDRMNWTIVYPPEE